MAFQKRRTKDTTIEGMKLPDASSVKLAAYIRVSTEDQASSGLGLAAQETQVNNEAARRGWPAPVLFIDAGVSGTKASRAQFDLLRAAIEAQQINVLIVSSIDRVGRSTRIIEDFIDFCHAHDCSFVSVKEAMIDTSTPIGRMGFAIHAAFAQYERDRIAQRTREALNERGTKFDYKSGMLPYGYKRIVDHGSEYIGIDEDMAKVVRSIFDKDRRGESTRKIAESLNRRGIPARRGGQWTHQSVQKILNNRETYKGKASDAYPAMI